MCRPGQRADSEMEWRVDPRNPGEVFACAGLAHLVWRADPEANTGFTADAPFRFVTPDPAMFLDGLAAESLVETEYGLRFADIELDWWREWGLNPGLKTWAGRQSAMTVHRNLLLAAQGSKPDDWLNFFESTTGRLNVDVLGTWKALDMGWSLNEHAEVRMLCRPWLELLASIGLQAFPVRGGKSSERGFAYRLWRPASLPVAVAAFGGDKPSVHATLRYRAGIDKSGSNTILRIASPA